MPFPKVRLQKHPETDAAQVLIDGVDVAPYILREGFRIEPDPDQMNGWRISMQVAAMEVEFDDLPDVLIDAIQAKPEGEGAASETRMRDRWRRARDLAQPMPGVVR